MMGKMGKPQSLSNITRDWNGLHYHTLPSIK